MGHRKEKWIAEPSGFRIGDGIERMAQRQRHQELVQKIKSGSISDAERDEFLRLDDALNEDDL